MPKSKIRIKPMLIGFNLHSRQFKPKKYIEKALTSMKIYL